MHKNYVTTFLGGKESGVNVGTSVDTITKGDILIVDMQNGAVIPPGTAPTADDYPIISLVGCKKDGVPIWSSLLFAKEMEFYSKNSPVPPQPKEMSIEFTETTPEPVRIAAAAILFSELRVAPNRQDRVDVEVFASTPEEAAQKLAAAFNAACDNNPNLQAHRKIIAEVDGQPVSQSFSADVIIADGNDLLSFQNVDCTTLDPAIAAGDILTIDGYTPVEVLEVNSCDATQLLVTLTAPWNQGDIPGANLNVTAESSVLTINKCVVKGILQEKDNPVDEYEQVDFDLVVDSPEMAFNIATVQEYHRGINQGWQCQDKEVDLQGWVGDTDKLCTMRNQYEFFSSLDLVYVVAELQGRVPVRTDLQQIHDGPAGVIVAINQANTAQINQIIPDLKAWADSIPGVDIEET